MKIIVVRGRVVRYEKGKEAEIFTLVIKGTNEENWYSTSTSGKEYIEISEKELKGVLSGEEVELVKREAEETDLMFRL